LKERDNLKDLGEDGMILKFILNIEGVGWLRIGSSDGLL
jgi:hypothetical protein